ncbi:MAG: extracellular solute-binding protein [Arcobacteraceae bacterium]|nr:extracellular solute-binding protein [Arcobacteraceae bacterium]
MLKLSFITILIILFTGCEDQTEPSQKTQIYTNQTITIITPNLGKKISGPILKEAKLFEKETGATIRVVTPSWADTIPKIEESLTDEKINYDIFVTMTSWSGFLFSNNTIEPIPQWAKDKLDWDDILPIYKKNILTWNGQDYAYPYDGDCINLYYRKDIFSNKQYKDKFQKEYGYQLNPPKTWQQYKDIAKFFNGWDWDNDGKIEYGIAGSRLKGYGTILQFFTQASAYVKHPNDKAYYFDSDSMKPRINNAGFVKALEDYIELMQYAPEEIYKFSPGDVRNSFIGGEVAMTIDWANTGTMAQNSKESVVKNLVGYEQLPGLAKVYNSKTNKWDNLSNTPSSISGNWVLLVNKNSKNKQLAIDFATHMSSKNITSDLVTRGDSGVNPSRYSHFENNFDLWDKHGFSKESAKEYLTTLKESLKNTNVMTDLRIESSEKYYNIISFYIDKAIKKELTVKQALDQAAKEWDMITDSIGREKQSKLYKASINE